MRIRKVAIDLGMEPEALIALLHEMGRAQFHSADQQISDDIVKLIRARLRERPISRVQPAANAPRSDFLPAAPKPVKVLPQDDAALLAELKGVLRLGERLQPAKPATPPTPPLRGKLAAVGAKLAATKPEIKPEPKPEPKPEIKPAKPAIKPPAPPVKAELKPATLAKPEVNPAGSIKPEAKPATSVIGEALDQQQADRAEIARLQARLQELERRNQELEARDRDISEDQRRMGAQLSRQMQATEAANRQFEATNAKIAALEAERDRLLDRLTQAERPGPTPIAALLERRGLRGADEHALAVRALLEARKDRELLSKLVVEDTDGLQALLFESIVLCAEGDDVPPGAISIRVPADRSESEPANAISVAARRFNSACLMQNVRSVLVVGGSPAYRRQLQQSVDERIRLRLISGTHHGRAADAPHADVTFIWAPTILHHAVSDHFPDGVRIPHRGIARMLTAAAEWIERRS